MKRYASVQGRSTISDNSSVFTADYNSHSSTIGCYSAASTAGHKSNAYAAGDYSPADTAGNDSNAHTDGLKSNARTIRNHSHAIATGRNSNTSTFGDNSISCSLGIKSRARAEKGWIVLVDWRYLNNNWSIEKVHCAKVGDEINGIKIKPDCQYWFVCGNLKEKKI